MKVGIVIPVLNQFKMAVDLIYSAKSNYHDVETFVIPNYRLNWTLSHAWNFGAASAFYKGCDYVLICNDDILLGRDCIDLLVDFMEDHPECVVGTAHNMRDRIQPDEILTATFDHDPNFFEGPDFACFMINRTTFDEVGEFDSVFTPAYFEDNDYHHRILKSGNIAYNVLAAKFYHYGSQTQNSRPNGIVTSPMFVANRQRYVDKWGGLPGEEKFDTPYNDPSKTYKDVTYND
jgi:GT2 family glycosyltransferase